MSSPRHQTDQVNNLDLSNWKQYEDILTDSLWILNSRDSSGAHQADYHGNFIPQIPNQLLRRFTRVGEVVLDPFMGNGTTAIEANRLRRKYIGVELSPSVVAQAQQRIWEDITAMSNHSFPETNNLTQNDNTLGIINGDSSNSKVAEEIAIRLSESELRKVQFIIMHPPYHSIIRFSNNVSDLSNCSSVEHFVERFFAVYQNIIDFLDAGRYLAVVIGDIYQNSEWIPLQNLVTAKLLSAGSLLLKSIIVKNMVNNRAKRNQEHLWRYRALANGFYIFKHEYIVVFQKPTQGHFAI